MYILLCRTDPFVLTLLEDKSQGGFEDDKFKQDERCHDQSSADHSHAFSFVFRMARTHCRPQLLRTAYSCHNLHTASTVLSESESNDTVTYLHTLDADLLAEMTPVPISKWMSSLVVGLCVTTPFADP